MPKIIIIKSLFQVGASLKTDTEKCLFIKAYVNQLRIMYILSVK